MASLPRPPIPGLFFSPLSGWPVPPSPAHQLHAKLSPDILLTFPKDSRKRPRGIFFPKLDILLKFKNAYACSIYSDLSSFIEDKCYLSYEILIRLNKLIAAKDLKHSLTHCKGQGMLLRAVVHMALHLVPSFSEIPEGQFGTQ